MVDGVWKDAQPPAIGPSDKLLLNKFFDLIIPFYDNHKNPNWLEGFWKGVYLYVFGHSCQLSKNKTFDWALMMLPVDRLNSDWLQPRPLMPKLILISFDIELYLEISSNIKQYLLILSSTNESLPYLAISKVIPYHMPKLLLWNIFVLFFVQLQSSLTVQSKPVRLGVDFTFASNNKNNNNNKHPHLIICCK